MQKTKARILVVEDDKAILNGLLDVLVFNGYDPLGIEDGAIGLETALREKFDLILLDIMLPHVDGFTICSRIRKAKPAQAIIIMTAKGSEDDIINGFKSGADDYICKPFSPREVVARVKAVLRRTNLIDEDDLQSEIFSIDEEKYEASYHGEPLNLTVVEFRLLKKLLSNQGKVFSRSQLIDQLYNDHRIVNDRTVDTHVKNLRKKLEVIAPQENVIRSVYGVGYKLDI